MLLRQIKLQPALPLKQQTATKTTATRTCSVGADDADARRLVQAEVYVLQDRRAGGVLEVDVHHLEHGGAERRHLHQPETRRENTEKLNSTRVAAAKK